MKFNHLNVPTHWRNYWSRYPEGHTILEALISWVSQVDSMVDNQNKLNDNVAQFRNEIDEFVERFDERLQTEVTQTLNDWQTSGFLDVVISEALQWQLDDYIATNEQDKLSLTAQLQQTGQELSSQLSQTRRKIKRKVGAYVEQISEADCKDMKELGIGYVVYYYYPSYHLENTLQQMRWLDREGIEVIFSLTPISGISALTTTINNFKNEPNIIGWYLDDEPDGRNISVADQDVKIATVRSLSSLPLCVATAVDSWGQRRISKNYDFYFLNEYVSGTLPEDDADLKFAILKKARSVVPFVGLEKCIPILQAYKTPGGNTLFSENDMMRLYRTTNEVNINAPIFHVYSADSTNPYTDTIKNNDVLRNCVRKVVKLCDLDIPVRSDISIQNSGYFQVNAVDIPRDEFLGNLLNLTDTALSIGSIGINETHPANVKSGFYPSVNGGRLVVDLGKKYNHLDIIYKAYNDKNINEVTTIKIDRVWGSGVLDSTNLYTTTFTTTITEEVILKNINSRYISIYFEGNFDESYNKKLILNGIIYIAI